MDLLDLKELGFKLKNVDWMSMMKRKIVIMNPVARN